MTQQKVTMLDKVIERIVNANFGELYQRTDFSTHLSSFKTQYAATTTDAQRIAVIAQFLGLT